jgi:hypothetical protein
MNSVSSMKPMSQNPAQHPNQKIFNELNRLNAQACELIDMHHREPVDEMTISETGYLISNLIKAHDEFIDNMRLYDLKMSRMSLQQQIDEIDKKQIEIKKRFEIRSQDGGGNGRPTEATYYDGRTSVDTGL